MFFLYDVYRTNAKSYIVKKKNNDNEAIPLTNDSWDNKEKLAIIKTLKTNQLTQSNQVLKLEKRVALYHDRQFCLMVNSGSSANLLGVSSMTLHSKLRINPGDEFIVPGIGWSTSYSPFIQNDLKVKFIDIDQKTLNIDYKLIEKNISKKTKGILAINILGNACDFNEINKIAKKHKLIILEDNCESLGAEYGKKKCGSFGLWSSLSSYYSHHISTIEGGFFLTDDHELFSIAKSIRSHGWVRDQYNNTFFKLKKYTDEKKKFLFMFPGYNIRSTDLNASAGLEQLKKLNTFVNNRRKNYFIVKKIVSKYQWVFLQKEIGKSSWFGFGLIFYTNVIKFNKIIKLFKKNRIDTRPIVTGNFTKQPVMSYYNKNKKTKYKLENCELVDKFGIMIGNSQIILKKNQIENLIKTFILIDKIINK
jgi:CDP-4-dehydro-6-deoxyglucose reductase, E1